MASRAKKKYRYRTEQQHTALRAGQQPGIHDVQIALLNLVDPDEEFYCNTAMLKRRAFAAQFVFGQTHPLATGIAQGLVLEIPYRAMPPLAQTFEAPGFRERLGAFSGAMTEMPPFPMMTRHVDVQVLGAHIARILINDFAGVVDFYEVEPRLGSSQPINPVIRVKSLPSVTRWFVDTVDSLAKEVSLGTQPEEPQTGNEP